MIIESPKCSPPAVASFVSLDVSYAFYHHSHPITLNNSHGCFPGDKFAFGDDIDDVIGETRLAARSQNWAAVPCIPDASNFKES